MDDLPENTPLLLRSLGVAEAEKIDTRRIFGQSTRETVGFEIVFSAFIATVVLSVPSTGTLLDIVGKSAAILLLGVTLARRMALDNPVMEQGRFFDRTTGHVLYLTLTGLVYTSIALAGIISPVLPIGVYLLAGILSFTIILLVILVYELLYGDFMFWTAVLLYNWQADMATTNQLGNGILRLARIALGISLHEPNREHPIVAQIFERDLGDAAKGSFRWALFVFGVGISLILIGVAGIGLLASYLADQQAIPILVILMVYYLAIIFLSGIVQFTYARYGNTTFEYATSAVQIHWSLILAYVMMFLHAGPLQVLQPIPNPF